MNVKRIAISMIAAALALGVLLPTAASAEGNGGSVEIQSRLTTPKQVRHPAEGGTWLPVLLANPLPNRSSLDGR